jgi:hypothetical protein
MVVLVYDAHAKFPIHLGGFAIGDDINLYPDKIDLESCRASIFNPYYGEGRIRPIPGFKSGHIAYGLCDKPNKIVRIKLKYNNPSKKFFDTLLKKFKAALGNPQSTKAILFRP